MMGNIKIEINPAYENLRPEIERIIFETIKGKDIAFLSDKKAKFLPKGGAYIYEGRNHLFRIDVRNTDENGATPVVVKDFKRPNLLNRYVYTTLRKSKARRSFENALKMEQLGFGTPSPVAYCEVKRKGALLWSFYVSVELEGVSEMRRWEEKPEVDTLLPAFAEEIWRLHQAGVWHKDFSPGNVLYRRMADGNYKFYHVDLNRMKFDVHDRRRQMRMFRAINLNAAEIERLARLYARVSGKDEEATVRQALDALEGYFREQRMKGKKGCR